VLSQRSGSKRLLLSEAPHAEADASRCSPDCRHRACLGNPINLPLPATWALLHWRLERSRCRCRPAAAPRRTKAVQARAQAQTGRLWAFHHSAPTGKPFARPKGAAVFPSSGDGQRTQVGTVPLCELARAALAHAVIIRPRSLMQNMTHTPCAVHMDCMCSATHVSEMQVLGHVLSLQVQEMRCTCRIEGAMVQQRMLVHILGRTCAFSWMLLEASCSGCHPSLTLPFLRFPALACCPQVRVCRRLVELGRGDVGHAHRQGSIRGENRQDLHGLRQAIVRASLDFSLTAWANRCLASTSSRSCWSLTLQPHHCGRGPR